MDWQEYRKVRSGYVAGHGLVKRIKIAKGLTYRIGAGRIGSLSSDEIKTIDSGDLYVTDKRMIFRGGQGNKNLPFGKIIAINLTMTGFEIERETGKNVYIPFNFKASPDKLAIIQFCNEVSE